MCPIRAAGAAEAGSGGPEIHATHFMMYDVTVLAYATVGRSRMVQLTQHGRAEGMNLLRSHVRST